MNQRNKKNEKMFTEKISVIVPCFNEERSIYDNIQKIYRYLKENFEDFEIIAVNDGSTDKTTRKLEKLKEEISIILVENPKNEGKGTAVKNGMMKSKNEIVMFLDADLAIPIEELPKFISEIKNGFDLAIASRFVPGLLIAKKVLWYRRIMEKIFRIIRMIILNNFEVKDTQCGFKVMKREAAMKIFPLMKIKRFAFDAEIIFVAKKFGYKIKELPITLQNQTISHILIVKDSFNMFFDLFKIRWNNFKKLYD